MHAQVTALRIVRVMLTIPLSVLASTGPQAIHGALKCHLKTGAQHLIHKQAE